MRYMDVAVPRWFNLNFRTPKFDATPHVNNLMAFFHFNLGDCRILPATHIINYEQ
jgi:hypothetical protein